MDDRLFRTAMGKFATGVTVITTERDETVHGMTANAFVSVSLDPKLILVSIGEKASMNQHLQYTGSFAISILNKDQEEMSAYFARQIKDEREVDFAYFNDMPVIKEALVHMTCQVTQMVVAGDHTLFIAEVNDLNILDGEPLLFYSGKYGEIK